MLLLLKHVYLKKENTSIRLFEANALDEGFFQLSGFGSSLMKYMLLLMYIYSLLLDEIDWDKGINTAYILSESWCKNGFLSLFYF